MCDTGLVRVENPVTRVTTTIVDTNLPQQLQPAWKPVPKVTTFWNIWNCSSRSFHLGTPTAWWECLLSTAVFLGFQRCTLTIGSVKQKEAANYFNKIQKPLFSVKQVLQFLCWMFIRILVATCEFPSVSSSSFLLIFYEKNFSCQNWNEISREPHGQPWRSSCGAKMFSQQCLGIKNFRFNSECSLYKC